MKSYLPRQFLALFAVVSILFVGSVSAADNWLQVSAALAPQGTSIDFTPHGTQPGLAWSLEDPESCASWHLGYTPGQLS